MAGKTRDYNIAVVESALKTLEAFLDDGHSGKTLNEVINTTGLNRTRAFRILSTLENHGYVYRDADDHRYRLGLRLLQLGQHTYLNLELVHMARPALADLCQQTGKRCSWVCWRGKTRCVSIGATVRTASGCLRKSGTVAPARGDRSENPARPPVGRLYRRLSEPAFAPVE